MHDNNRRTDCNQQQHHRRYGDRELTMQDWEKEQEQERAKIILSALLSSITASTTSTAAAESQPEPELEPPKAEQIKINSKKPDIPSCKFKSESHGKRRGTLA